MKLIISYTNFLLSTMDEPETNPFWPSFIKTFKKGLILLAISDANLYEKESNDRDSVRFK